MRKNLDIISAYSIMLGLIILVGFLQSWSMALSILCLCLISAVMTMGANIQWGYAGLINFGIMGYTALGGLAAVLVSVPPVREAWQVGGFNMILCAFLIAFMVFSIRFIMKKYNQSKKRSYGIATIIILGLILLRLISAPAIESIESVNPATTGFLGGMGLPILFSWIVGAFFAGAFFLSRASRTIRSSECGGGCSNWKRRPSRLNLKTNFATGRKGVKRTHLWLRPSNLSHRKTWRTSRMSTAH